MTQHGVSPGGLLRAIAITPARDPVPFLLRDADGAVLAEGMTDPFGPDEASGAGVHVISLTAPEAEADGLVLEACGGASRPFRVKSGLYAELSEDALRYFYHNRIGIPIEERFVQGPEWARPESLNPVIASCFSGTDTLGNSWPGCDYSLDVTGSWFDAGDFGVYAVNMGITIWTLQSAYERLAVKGLVEEAGWADGRMQLPETGNGVSELLDEARWGMESLLRLQVPEGGQTVVARGLLTGSGQPAILTRIAAGGLVHHKLAGRNWPPLPIWPWDDAQERYLYPPSTSATLALAATGAQCARLWAGLDDAFAGRCFDAARRAYDAAKRHPEIYASNNFDGSGGYGDNRLQDEFAWAAAELFITSGDPAYLSDLAATPAFAAPKDSFGWADVDLLPALSLAVQADDRHRDTSARARRTVVNAADSVLNIRDREGFRTLLAPGDYHWGSNSMLINRGLILAAAYDLTGEARYREGAVDAMDYILGRNILDQSYVSGYGARPMRAPHHRIWAGAIDPAFPLPPPGALSGGPNNRNMSDPVAQEMRGTCAPMACWADDVASYALNEVAINWNAPLAALAIFLDQTERAGRTRQETETGE
ncbi:glycoside hydrolase family 9 protein [Hyphomonas sp.]|uniref:glycoside hydrolase family 9 protein n=1 Tax=Hyphomonas sp. TaxID=87 RepID=UPI00391CFABA